MSMRCSQVMYSEEYIQPSKLFPSRVVLTWYCCLLRGKSLVLKSLIICKDLHRKNTALCSNSKTPSIIHVFYLNISVQFFYGNSMITSHSVGSCY